ncbi:Fungal protease inhibitor-1 [Blattella germanica]|nr:Fungal protease inhibitor-1 [Blattella germanica]
MKIYFGLCIVVAVCVWSTSAIVCPPNYCAGVKCAELTSCPDNALLEPNSSFCGCCSTCITQLNEGDPCLLLTGSPAFARCKSPLSCVGGICVP